jgi:adenylate kinase
MRRLLKRGRKIHPGNNVLHDSPERIKERLEMYCQGEKAVLNFYKNKGILEEIDGERPIEEVSADLAERIND